jgi:hypothetical protein
MFVQYVDFFSYEADLFQRLVLSIAGARTIIRVWLWYGVSVRQLSEGQYSSLWQSLSCCRRRLPAHLKYALAPIITGLATQNPTTSKIRSVSVSGSGSVRFARLPPQE